METDAPMTNSRQKGKRGELEFAKVLTSLGIDARRSQQYAGNEGTADLKTCIPGLHVEVKRRATIGAARFMDQAERDCLPNDLPIVALREDRGSWMVLVKAQELPRLIEKIHDALQM